MKEKLEAFVAAVKSYLKRFWYLIVISFLALLLIILILINKKRVHEVESVMQLYTEQLIAERKAIEEIKAARDREIARNAEIEKTYEETIRLINANHDNQIRELAANKEKEIRAIISETQDKPELMAARINTLFGIAIYHEN